MDWITTSGNTLDEAKSHALDQLGIVADDAEFDVVNDVEKGLFGRVKTEAKIRARVRPKQTAVKEDRGRRRSGGGSGGSSGGGGRGRGQSQKGEGKRGSNDRGGSRNKTRDGSKSSDRAQAPQERADTSDDDQPAKEESRRPAKASSDSPQRDSNSRKARTKNDNVKRDTVEHEISREDQEQAATDFLEGVLSAFDMTGNVAVAEEAADDDAIEMVVTGDELGLLVGQKGITLNSLQELTRTVVQRKADGAKTDRLRVDVAGYRARRTAALQDFAGKIATDVLESGTEKLLEPMGPADRKVVHDTVNGIDGVETGSEGEEPRRRVVIRPV